MCRMSWSHLFVSKMKAWYNTWGGAGSVIFWDWEGWLTSPDTTLAAMSRMHSKTKSVVVFSLYV